MSSVKLGWASAQVKDGTLTVALEGKVPKGWKESFERTVKLLGDGDWDAVALKRGKVEVRGVSSGTEDKLRHHLEAVVAQANSALEAREAKSEARDDDGDEPEGPDAEMTARFREFAEDDDGAQEDESA